MPTIDKQIILVQNVFFVPVDKPEEPVDLSDFSNEHSEKFGDAIFLDLPEADMFQLIDGQYYIATEIPFFRNGESLNLDEVINGQLRRTVEYLHGKGLREDTIFPGLIVQESFGFDLQAAG
ncbi:MAG: hypothetical protein V4611_04200 [Patescibacteria group bacterium]